jgi:hypothetical protein
LKEKRKRERQKHGGRNIKTGNLSASIFLSAFLISGLRETQTLSGAASFRRGWRMVRAGGGAGRLAEMAKSSEWRTDFGRFWLRRGIGFAGLDGCKDCAMPGTETGESKSWAKGGF